MANLATFDLNLLRVLDALLRERTTVGAGKRLGLSQPAVSAALGRLRAALGDELFFRRAQGLEPTVHALSLEADLHRILARVESVIGGPRVFDPAVATNRFRLSGSDFFAELLMPQLAERLARVAPQVMVHLVDLVPDNYVDTLERYEVDLALIPATRLPDWIESRPVFRSSFSVVARAEHPRIARAGLTEGDVLPLDLFCDIGHVLFSPEGRATAMGDAALERVGRKRRVAMTLPVFSGVCRAVAGSDLIALLPSALARDLAGPMGLAVFRPPIPVPKAAIAMIWHRRFRASPAHVWFRDQVAEALAPLDEVE